MNISSRTHQCMFVTASLLGEISRYTLISNIIESLSQENIDFRILEYRPKAPSDMELANSKGLLDRTISLSSDFNRPIKLMAVLYQERPDILLIGGYGHLVNWLAMIYALVTGSKIVLWSGAGTETHKNSGRIHRSFKKFFVSRAHRYVSYGSSAYRYLESLGAPVDKISKAVNVSDIDFFATLPKPEIADKINQVIKNDQLDPACVRTFIFVGQMNYRKGVDLLLENLALLDNKEYFCHFVGDGPLAQDVRSAISEGAVSGYFWGRMSRENVRELMHNSDVYVLPTRFDPFSRTLSEAIASGCYCLNSVLDDATEDLLIEKKNGESFDPGVSDELYALLKKVSRSDFGLPDKDSIRSTLQFSSKDYANTVTSSVLEGMGRES